MQLDIYTPELAHVGTIEAFESLQWVRRYHEAGQFELHLPFDIALPIQRGNYLVKDYEACIIESLSLSYSAEKGSEMTVRGRSPIAFTSFRVLSGVHSIQGTEEAVMTELTSRCFTGDRAVSGLTIAASQGRGNQIEYQCESVNLYDELCALSQSSGLGLAAVFSPTGITLQISSGADRTTAQSINSRAIFSRAYENALTESYDEDESESRTVAVVIAEYADAEITETVGTAMGAQRRELLVRAGNVEKDEDDTALTEAQARALMRQKGAEALAEAEIDRSYTITADPNGNLRYKTDYDIGDVVSVQSPEWNKESDVRITEVNEIYEAKGYSIELTLGSATPNLKKKVRMWANG